MSDIFGGDSFLEWSLTDPAGMAVTRQTATAYPNGGAVAVNRPGVDTGGSDWGQWFDRLVGGAIALRNSFGGDARVTGYPGTPYGPAYSGQQAPAMQSGIPGWLILGGLALAALYVLKD